MNTDSDNELFDEADTNSDSDTTTTEEYSSDDEERYERSEHMPRIDMNKPVENSEVELIEDPEKTIQKILSNQIQAIEIIEINFDDADEPPAKKQKTANPFGFYSGSSSHSSTPAPQGSSTIIKLI